MPFVHGGASSRSKLRYSQGPESRPPVSFGKTPHRSAEARRVADPERILRIVGASGNNLKNVIVEIPAGLMTCVTGVSGSGKSTLINDTLYRQTAVELNGASEKPAPFKAIEGLDLFDKVVEINQSPIGRTPRRIPRHIGPFHAAARLFAQFPSRVHAATVPVVSVSTQGRSCERCRAMA